MSKTPNYDAKVKTILENLQPGERTCELTGEKWMMDEEEIGWYKKFNVPPSAWHPLTRVTICTCFATGFGWWHNKHAETGEKVLAYVHPATGIKVLPDPEFFERDFTDRGRGYDPDKNFFDQIRELQLATPFTAWRSIKIPVNSIALLSQGDENSYFVTACRSKNSMYGYSVLDMEDSAEVYESNNIHKSFSVLISDRIYNCRFVRQCFDCLNCDFIFDSRNCEDCFGAWNMRNKKYIWWGEQLSKEEWEKRRAEVDLGSRETLEKNRALFQEKLGNIAIWPENFNEQCEDSIGEGLRKCRDCKYIYAGFDSSNCYWGCVHLGRNEDNAFLGGAIGTTHCFYSHAPVESSNCKYVHSCYRCQNLEYCMQCYNCENCFGCVGLNRKSFCIFNTQYTEEEYWKRLDEIKCRLLDRGEYGEFFPLKFSPNYFYASAALIYLLDEAKEKALGALHIDPESYGAVGEEPEGVEKMTTADIPDHIRDMDPSVWAKRMVFDEKERRRFSFIAPEIRLYKQLNIAPSNIHPMTRLKNLVFEANSAIFVDATCNKCGKALTVSKNATYQNRKIYCREDYLKHLEQYG